jgi:hypothetical protein
MNFDQDPALSADSPNEETNVLYLLLPNDSPQQAASQTRLASVADSQSADALPSSRSEGTTPAQPRKTLIGHRSAAIISLCLSGFSLLMLVLAFLSGQSIAGAVACRVFPNESDVFFSAAAPIVGPLIVLIIFTPSLLAIIFSFMVKWDWTHVEIVTAARTLSVALFLIFMLVVPILFFLLFVNDGAAIC